MLHSTCDGKAEQDAPVSFLMAVGLNRFWTGLLTEPAQVSPLPLKLELIASSLKGDSGSQAEDTGLLFFLRSCNGGGCPSTDACKAAPAKAAVRWLDWSAVLMTETLLVKRAYQRSNFGWVCSV